MIVGNGPSPLAGKATLTSIGVLSKVLVVLLGAVLPQNRTPSGCAVQATSPPKTDADFGARARRRNRRAGRQGAGKRI